MPGAYKVSADTSEKEKAVGGILTFGQAGWLVLGALISAGLFIAISSLLSPIVGLFIALPPGVAFGCIFAFYKKEQLPLSTYIMYKYTFDKKSKQMVNTLTYGKKFEKEDELFL